MSIYRICIIINAIIVSAVYGMENPVEQADEHCESRVQGTLLPNERLLLAARRGDVLLAAEALCDQADVNALDEDGQMAIHRAAVGDLDFFQWLVLMGADIRSKSSENVEPIHCAAQAGRKEIVQYLERQQEIDINVATSNKMTPLMLAVEAGQQAMVEQLLEAGAEVFMDMDEAEMGFYGTPMHCAARLGHLDIMKLLVKDGVASLIDVPPSERTLFLLAEKEYKGDLALDTAIAQGHFDVVRWLVAELKQPLTNYNRYDNSPLHYAAKRGHLNIVQFLVEQGAGITDHNDSGKQPIHSAARGGHIPIIQWLIKQGACITAKDKDGKQPIHHAILSKGSKPLISWFIHNGAAIDARDNAGNTLLHVAVREGNIDAIEYLLGWEMPCDSRDKQRVQPIHIASLNGHSSIVKLLVGHGASIDARDDAGEQPIHKAALGASLEVAEWLFEQGASVNVLDNEGRTPLFNACQSGDQDLVEWLIKHGADINASDALNRYPIGDVDIYEGVPLILWLIEHGAHVDMPRLLDDTEFYERFEEEFGWLKEVAEGNIEEVKSRLGDDTRFDKYDFHEAFLLMIALNREELIDFVLSNKMYLIQGKELSKCLEVTAAVGRRDVFERLYREMMRQLDTNIMLPKDLLVTLENLLYWALVSGKRQIVDFIIERMASYSDELCRSITKLVASREDLPEEYKDLLATLEGSQRLRKGFKDSLYTMVGRVPSETIAVMLRLAFPHALLHPIEKK